MPPCIHCGSPLVRSRRTAWEKLFYRAAYRCTKCAERIKEPVPGSNPLSRHCQCPRCGNPNPSVRLKPDKIDKLVRTPWRLIHRLLGGTLYHCAFCRLQFHDVRERQPAAARSKFPDPSNMPSGD